MPCPKCGNTWIVNHVIVEIQGFRKHWWSNSKTVSYHEAYPNEPPYYCPSCGHKWGTWHQSKNHYINPQQVGQIKDALEQKACSICGRTEKYEHSGVKIIKH